MLESRERILNETRETLERQLASTDLGAVDRFNSESMLSSTLRELAELQAKPVRMARVQLTFRGGPVHGTRGIDADFGLDVTESFQRAIHRRATVRARQNSKNAYQIPRPLAIVDVARGSFGFVMEEIVPEDGSLMGDTHLTQAVDDMESVLDLACQGSEAAFIEAVKTLDGGTQSALRDLMDISGAAGASFRLEDESHDIALESQAIQTASRWLHQIEVNEDVVPMRGTLTGIFAVSRKFEFVPDGRRAIYGVLSEMLPVPEILLLEQRRCMVNLQVNRIQKTTAHNKGKPSYTLLAAKLCQEDEKGLGI